MSRKQLILLGIVLVLLCLIWIAVVGRTYTLEVPLDANYSADNFTVGYDDAIVRLRSQT